MNIYDNSCLRRTNYISNKLINLSEDEWRQIYNNCNMSAKIGLAQQDELPVDLQIELASHMDENIIIALFNKDHVPIEVARAVNPILRKVFNLIPYSPILVKHSKSFSLPISNYESKVNVIRNF